MALVENDLIYIADSHVTIEVISQMLKRILSHASQKYILDKLITRFYENNCWESISRN